MSRNIGMGPGCDFCPGDVSLVEATRPITKAEAGVYFDEYEGMPVANAVCVLCDAKYLAWIDWPLSSRHIASPKKPGDLYVDLSFRSTFNDEPGLADMPKHKIEAVTTYNKTPWVE